MAEDQQLRKRTLAQRGWAWRQHPQTNVSGSRLCRFVFFFFCLELTGGDCEKECRYCVWNENFQLKPTPTNFHLIWSSSASLSMFAVTQARVSTSLVKRENNNFRFYRSREIWLGIVMIHRVLRTANASVFHLSCFKVARIRCVKKRTDKSMQVSYTSVNHAIPRWYRWELSELSGDNECGITGVAGNH